DGDGFLDILTSTEDPSGQLLFFRNRGDGTFEDRTEAAGLLGQLGGLNLVHADYDGDGDRDVLLLRGGWLGVAGCMPKSLLRNEGNGTFTDVTETAGLGPPDYPSQTAAFADYDLDGDLDLFVGNEVPEIAEMERYPCQLYRNDGDGTFTERAASAGVENRRLTKGVAWGDVDGDRYPDLYCSNQFNENRLYRNNRDGTFTDIGPERGVADRQHSFSVWFWDYDQDGRLDLFVAGYGGDMNQFVRSYLRPSPKFGNSALFRNEGGTFRDVAKEAGLTLHVLTMGANFGDLDNDGWLDFYLGTGAPDYDALQPNVMYRNDGAGSFQDVTTSGGFGQIRKGHAIAWGDLDNDGDEDIYLQSGGFYPYDGFFNSLFRNPGHGNRWVTLRLRGTRSNRDAFGARIRVRVREGGHTRDLYRWMWPAGSFGSSSLQQEIGLGRAEAIESVEVTWPCTERPQVFRGLEPDACYLLTEGKESAERVDRPRVAPGR
ncbi:CRTAC1 family protein, partial [bacterium]|nr:CRTAC1 family protein [bacterium]